MYHIAGQVTRRLGAALLAVARDPLAPLARLAARQTDRAMLFAPVVMGGGIWLWFFLPFDAPVWLLVSLLSISVFAVWQWRDTALRLAAFALLLFAVGLAAAGWRSAQVAAPILPAEVGPAALTGAVLDIDRLPERLRLTIAPAAFGGLRAEDLPEKLRISVRKLNGPVQPGDQVTMRAMATPPSSPAEPGSFDFQRHAWFKGIGGYGYAMGTAEVTPATRRGWHLNAFRDRLTARIMAAMTGRSGGIAAALIMGDRSAIAEADNQAMRDSGLAHLLAISGLHMGLVTGFLFVGLRMLLALFPRLALYHPIKKWAALAALAGGTAYLILTGGSVPTVRAFVMVGLVMLAVLTNRRAISLRTVAIAALLILLITPEALMEPGFQMSFAAVTALVAAYETFGARLARDEGEGLLTGLPARYLAGVALTTLIAGLATGPYAIYHFNRFADYGLIANLAAVPMVAFWVMPMATLAMLAMPVGLEWLPLQAMGLGIDAVLWVAHGVAELPGAVRLVPAMPGWGLAAISLGGLGLCLLKGGRRYLGLAPLALGLISPYVSERPLIRIDADARIIAVRGADGTMLSNTRRERFTSDQWLARDAETGPLSWPGRSTSGDGSLRCDTLGCILRTDGWMIALPASTAAIAEDCRRADIVISLEPVPDRCPSARLLVDRFDVWRDGAHALYMNGGRPELRSTRGDRGRRAWTPDPVPRKNQYWRNRAASRP